MESVYLLWHVHDFGNGREDEKLIGVYRTKNDAQAALHRARKVDGFKDFPTGFEISEYPLNQDHWTEGFTTI